MIRTTLDFEIRSLILNQTRPLDYINNFPNGESIFRLSKEIYEGKKKLNYNAVDFVIAKLLDKHEKLINITRRNYINLFIIGSFKNDFIPTQKVAQALADFYLEMRVLPNLITIREQDIMQNPKILNLIKSGIRIYDRERNLH